MLMKIIILPNLEDFMIKKSHVKSWDYSLNKEGKILDKNAVRIRGK